MTESNFRQWMGDRINPRVAVNQASYRRVAEMIREATHVVAFTGAGISTRSGIPDFRSPQSGLWQQVDPMAVASIWGFREEPERFYSWLRPLARKMVNARPNRGHRVLTQLQEMDYLHEVITQNVDDLHQRAGTRQVIPVHGSADGAICLQCRLRVKQAHFLEKLLASEEELPQCPLCEAVLKPDVVLFGEELPQEAHAQAQQAALTCDLMIVIGTSLEVMPASDLPLLAKRRGAQIVIVNLGGSLYDHRADLVLHQDATVALPQIAKLLQRS